MPLAMTSEELQAETLKALQEIQANQDFLSGQYEALTVVLTSVLAAVRDAGMPPHILQTILADLDQWRRMSADKDAATPAAQQAGFDAAANLFRPVLSRQTSTHRH